MRKLASRILLLLALVLVTYILIILAARPKTSSSALAAIVDKDRLVRTTPSPKVLFVGGSNVAVGIDSPMVQEKLGMPVVNMGLHGGLGLVFPLNQVKPYLGAGDLVVLSPEYQDFFGLANGDDTLLDILYIDPSAAQYIEPKQWLTLAGQLPASMQFQFQGVIGSLFVKEENPVYYRSGFNQNGDVVSHLNKPSTIDLTDKHLFGSTTPTFDDTSIGIIDEFTAYAQSRGARVVFFFPPIPDSQYAENEKLIQLVCRRLAETATVTIAGRPSDYAFPITFFFDTLYHLNAQGRQVRTEKIVEQLTSISAGKAVKPDCSQAESGTVRRR